MSVGARLKTYKIEQRPVSRAEEGSQVEDEGA